MVDKKISKEAEANTSGSTTESGGSSSNPTEPSVSAGDQLPSYGELGTDEHNFNYGQLGADSKKREAAPAYNPPVKTKGKNGKESAPPEYYSSEGWGDDANNDFEASTFLRAVIFENQRWYPIVGWSETGPMDRRNYSSGDGSRGSGGRPKITRGKMWQLDRSGYPEKCDIEGWTYANGFDDLRDTSKDGVGKESTDMVFVRRRRWVSPVPKSLLQHAKYRDMPEKSTKHVDDDMLVWDLIETEVVDPKNDSDRTWDAHLTPESIIRRGFATVEGTNMEQKGEMWISVENKQLNVFSDRREPKPIKCYNMREIREVIFKPFADPYGIVLVFNGPHRKEKLSLRFKDEKECRKWFDDLDNVRVALRNWDIAKGVGVVIAGALLGAAARRR